MPRTNSEKMRLSGFATQLSLNGCDTAQIRTAAGRYETQHGKRQERLGGMRTAIKAKASQK